MKDNILKELNTKFQQTSDAVNIDQTLLGTENITNVWYDVFSVNAISLTNLKSSLDNNLLKVQGLVDSLPGFEGVNINIIFFIDSNNLLQSIIYTTLNEVWRFKSTFNKMPCYIANNITTTQDTICPNIFNNISCSDMNIAISSYDFSDCSCLPQIEIPQFELNQVLTGFNFSGAMSINNAISDLLGFLGGHINTNIIGYTRLLPDKNDTRLYIVFNIAKKINLGPLSIYFSDLTISSSVNSKSIYSSSSIGLNGYIEMNKSKDKVDIKASYIIGVGTLVIQGVFEKISLSNGLADISELLGGADLQKYLPEPLHVLDMVYLESISIGVLVDKPKITNMELIVSVDTQWEVIPSVIKLENIKFDLNVKVLANNQFDMEFMIYGIFKVGKGDVLVCADYPDFLVSGELCAGDSISITDLLAKTPLDVSGLPEIDILDFFVLANPKQNQYKGSITIANNWTFNVAGKPFELKEVALNIDYTGGSNPTIQGSVMGLITLVDVDLVLRADYSKADGWQLSGNTSIDTPIKFTDIITDIFDDIKVPVPTFLPEINVVGIAFSLNTKTHYFSFSGEIQNGFSIKIGQKTFALPDSKFIISYDGTTNVELNATIVVSDKSMDFTCALAIGEQNNSLNATIKVQKEGESISITDMINQFLPDTLQIPDGIVNIDFTDFIINKTDNNLDIIADIDTKITIYNASFEVKSVSFYHHKLSKDDEYGINIVGCFQLKIAGQGMKISGTLSITKEKQATVLLFKPDSELSPLKIPLPISTKDGNIEFDIALEDISFFDDKTKGMGLSIDSIISYNNMFPKVATVLHNDIKSSIEVSNEGILLSVDEIINPITFDIKPPVGDLDFGNMSINFTDIILDLRDPVAIMMNIDIALPQELNKVFGTDSNGDATIILFRTYDASKPDNNAVKVQLKASSKGIIATLYNSPIVPIAIKDGHCNFSLGKDGEFGTIDFKMPTFSYDADNLTFSGCGGFTAKNLQLPMIIFKKLFEGFKMQTIANRIPTGIPFTEIDLFDNETGKIRVDDVIDFIQDGISLLTPDKPKFKLPQPMVDMIHKFEDVVDGLPDRLKYYLNIEIPESFYFRFNIKMDGDINLEVSVNDLDSSADKKPDNKPIKLLLPSMSEFGPELCGVELYGFSFGDILDGALFSCYMDFVCDNFSLIPIILGLPEMKKVLPKSVRHYLPDAKQFQNTWTVRRFVMLIEYETEIPIPIPLFFTDIGVDYYSIEGVKISTHFGFPMPGLNVGEICKVAKNLYSFFTNKKATMPTEPPKDFDLKFIMGQSTSDDYSTGNPIELTLPKYLGGKSLAIPYTLVSAYSLIAHAMNWCKSLTLNELVQAIELKYRIGHESISFFNLDANLDWVIATPYEFKNKAYKQLKLAEGSDEIDNILKIIPQKTASSDEGLIAFFKGDINIGSELSLNSIFTFAISKGFTTAFNFSETIANILSIRYSGDIMVEIPKDTYNNVLINIQGDVSICFDDQILFEEKAEIEMVGDALVMKGSIKTLKQFPFELNCDGRLSISKTSGLKLNVDMHENINLFGIVIYNEEENISFSVSNNGLFLHVNSTTHLFGCDFFIKGDLEICNDGLYGELIMDSDVAQILNIDKYKLCLEANDSLMLKVTPQKQEILITAKINIPDIIDSATLTGSLSTELSGALMVNIQQFNVGVITLSDVVIILNTGTITSLKVHGQLHYIGGTVILDMAVKPDGKFSSTIDDKLNLGVPSILEVCADGLTITNESGHFEILPINPHIHIMGIANQFDNLNLVNQSIPINLPSFNIGLITIKGATYTLDCKSKSDISLTQNSEGHCDLDIFGGKLTASNVIVKDFFIRSNKPDSLRGSLFASTKILGHQMSATNYTLYFDKGCLACNGCSSTSLLGQRVTLEGFFSVESFCFTGGVDFSGVGYRGHADLILSSSHGVGGSGWGQLGSKLMWFPRVSYAVSDKGISFGKIHIPL